MALVKALACRPGFQSHPDEIHSLIGENKAHHQCKVRQIPFFFSFSPFSLVDFN